MPTKSRSAAKKIERLGIDPCEKVLKVPLCECLRTRGRFLALLSEKQELTTRDGKPYYRVAFRDARREVRFPIWSDSPLAERCRHEWMPGQFYKLRAVLRQSNYGPQLEIKKIRPVEDADRRDGFDPLMCQPASRFDPVEMFAELINSVELRIDDSALRQSGSSISWNRTANNCYAAGGTNNHHAFVSGYLEHVLNVTRTCCQLADRYAELYNDLGLPSTRT